MFVWKLAVLFTDDANSQFGCEPDEFYECVLGLLDFLI